MTHSVLICSCKLGCYGSPKRPDAKQKQDAVFARHRVLFIFFYFCGSHALTCNYPTQSRKLQLLQTKWRLAASERNYDLKLWGGGVRCARAPRFKSLLFPPWRFYWSTTERIQSSLSLQDSLCRAEIRGGEEGEDNWSLFYLI